MFQQTRKVSKTSFHLLLTSLVPHCTRLSICHCSNVSQFTRFSFFFLLLLLPIALLVFIYTENNCCFLASKQKPSFCCETLSYLLPPFNGVLAKLASERRSLCLYLLLSLSPLHRFVCPGTAVHSTQSCLC